MESTLNTARYRTQTVNHISVTASVARQSSGGSEDMDCFTSFAMTATVDVVDVVDVVVAEIIHY